MAQVGTNKILKLSKLLSIRNTQNHGHITY